MGSECIAVDRRANSYSFFAAIAAQDMSDVAYNTIAKSRMIGGWPHS
jgi:hypothetical protein